MAAGPAPTLPPQADNVFSRILRGFLGARVAVAVVLLLLVGGLISLRNPTALALLGLYLALALAAQFALPAPRVAERLGRLWLPTVGIDLLAFTALQMLQPGGLSYTPLLALPVIMAALLGTRTMARATAAAAVLVQLADAARGLLLHEGGGLQSQLPQAAVTGTGYFLIAFVMQPLAERLEREQQQAQRSRMAAALQSRVNEVVIESLADGVLVLDARGLVRAANPAALVLLDAEALQPPFDLAGRAAWAPLAALARRTAAGGAGHAVEVTLQPEAGGPRRLQVRTRPTSLGEQPGENLCVMFMQDLRDTEARLRTEKLAAMGRMSAAVAHEIRNPLTAIVQANALLAEDLQDGGQQRLCAMVEQNARRLARIAEEVLDVARAQRQLDHTPGPPLPLEEAVALACADWQRQPGHAAAGLLVAPAAGPAVEVEFDPEHLRRILVNLLDNALRYISDAPQALQVRTWVDADGQAHLEVWSDGRPLEPGVEQRLFEPFFSSESRSSGLGLYICRELCARHGATLGYRRGAPHGAAGGAIQGNAFEVAFRPAVRSAETAFATIVV